jgi:hypothetical protein
MPLFRHSPFGRHSSFVSPFLASPPEGFSHFVWQHVAWRGLVVSKEHGCVPSSSCAVPFGRKYIASEKCNKVMNARVKVRNSIAADSQGEQCKSGIWESGSFYMLDCSWFQPCCNKSIGVDTAVLGEIAPIVAQSSNECLFTDCVTSESPTEDFC